LILRAATVIDRAPAIRRSLPRSLALAALVLCLLPRPLSAACAPRPGFAVRWTLQRRDGVSWLADPCGAPFFSIGVNTLTSAATPSPNRGPDRKTRLAPSLAPQAWAARAAGQIGAWGFNTAGAFSAFDVPLPSIPDLDLGWRARLLWDDPFDPSAQATLTARTREAVAPYRTNEYRIGYFSDNEIGWWYGALFTFYLARPASNYTKQALVGLIRRHYGGDWRRFTADFVVAGGISSFDQLLHGADARAQLRPGGRGIRMIREWTGAVTRRYYETVYRALRAADPDAIIFGDRLPSYYDPDAVRSMAPFVDAVATNYNVDSPDGWIAHYYFDALRELTGNKPVLVSEWYFAAAENRSGNTNNGYLMTVRTQAERARGAANAARNFAREPAIVGLHWFQYYDEPRGGRPLDREDYDFGLLDIGGRPYEELVSALTAANRSLAGIHANTPLRAPAAQSSPQALSIDSPIRIPAAALDAASFSLAPWPKDAALVKGFSTPAPEVVFGDFFLAWSEAGLHVATISMDHFDGSLLAYDGDFPRGEAFRIDFGVDAGAGARRFAFFVLPPMTPLRDGGWRKGNEMRVEVCRMDHETCTPVPSATALYQVSDRPRITAQVTLPWQVLGVAGGRAGSRLRVQLAATAFYRSRWMSLGGAAPARAMEDLKSWRPAVLAARPGA
jgi:hypothetical protein